MPVQGELNSLHRGTKATISILVLLFASVAAFPASVTATTGTLTISTDTVLTEDHVGNIVIAADGVTLDCAGFAVIGSGFEDTGIELRGRTGVTVKNCKVTGFFHGFLLVSSPGNTLTGNTADGNVHTGFFVVFSSGNTLAGNTANGNSLGFTLQPSSNGNTLTGNTANGNGFFGFLLDSSDNTLTGNTANGNDFGFLLTQSSGNTLTENTAEGNGQGGFVIFTFSIGNTLEENTATGNNVGFHLSFVSGNTLVGNTAHGNSHGFVLDLSSDNTLTGNMADGNSIRGFQVQGLSNDNTFEKNTADSNGQFGFGLSSSSGNTLTGNTADGHPFDGFFITASGNTLTENTATGNQRDGFGLSSSSGNALERNTANGNRQDGFNAAFSDLNTLTGNTANGNRRGFFLTSSSGNTLTKNTANGNVADGFRVATSSSGNTLTGNMADDNGVGFVLTESSGNTIFRNNIIDNSVQAFDNRPAINDWHDPVSEEGNFWSDYAGADDGSGTGKHAIAGDGIGDTRIPHPGPGFDNFPFTSPIVVEDTIPPSITAPANLRVPCNTAGAATGVDLGTPTISDDVDPPEAITVTNDAPATFPLGTTTVTWTATDSGENAASAIQLVTVIDTTPPTIVAPPDITVIAESAAGAVVDVGAATASDVCDPAPVILNDAPPIFPAGTTIVTWTATDAEDNQATATQSVTVLTPRDLKENAMAELEAIEAAIRSGAPRVGDPEEAIEEIEEAIEAILESLDPELWATTASGDLDPFRLDPEEGDEVFEEEAEAVEAIFEAIDDGEIADPSLIDRLLGVVALLIQADRLLAQIAIDDAKADPTADTEEIAEAEESLAEGDELVERAAGADLDEAEDLLEDAIKDAYGEAWEDAQEAREDEDEDDEDEDDEDEDDEDEDDEDD